jgi:hypothetical protein
MFAYIWDTLHTKDRIGALWCSMLHDSPKWPIHGHYECSACGRRYRVPWAERKPTGAAILSVLLLIAVAAWPSLGAEITAANASAEAALQRFVVSQGESGAWPVETIQIEASLPGMKKTGRLRAIRRRLPLGPPDYQVLEIAGDSTVKNQVIVRYISADKKAAEISPSSVALTPANYKIHYEGAFWLGDRLTYAFRVIPRKKREGLFNGVLWLDSETSIAVRESGYLAKNPSVFVKCINLTRENELQNGAITGRITHVSIETRLVGRAQLVVVEHPGSGELTVPGTADGGR